MSNLGFSPRQKIDYSMTEKSGDRVGDVDAENTNGKHDPTFFCSRVNFSASTLPTGFSFHTVRDAPQTMRDIPTFPPNFSQLAGFRTVRGPILGSGSIFK